MRLNLYDPPLEWASRDPEGLRSAAKAVVTGLIRRDDNASRLLAIIKSPRCTGSARSTLAPSDFSVRRPQRLLEAVEILIARREMYARF